MRTKHAPLKKENPFKQTNFERTVAPMASKPEITNLISSVIRQATAKPNTSYLPQGKFQLDNFGRNFGNFWPLKTCQPPLRLLTLDSQKNPYVNFDQT